MYRDFKELEARLAAFGQTGQTSSSDVGASSVVGAKSATSETSAVLSIASGGDISAVGHAEAGKENTLRALKTDKDAKKQEIKLWIKEFEEREGRLPTAE